MYPIFIIDPWFANPSIVGVNRYAFLLETLVDLNTQLVALGTRLYVLQGKPMEVLPKAISKWAVTTLTYENDSEPYAKVRDKSVNELMAKLNVKVLSFSSHTLHDLERYVDKAGGTVPTTYGSFCKLFDSLPPPRKPIPAPLRSEVPQYRDDDSSYDVPSLASMGYPPLPAPLVFKGGETVALARLQATCIEKKSWVSLFEKPNTSPNSLQPSTTVLSPCKLKLKCDIFVSSLPTPFPPPPVSSKNHQLLTCIPSLLTPPPNI